MSEAMTRSATIRFRLPRQLLTVVDEWAAVHDMPRSTAIQAMILRGMAWEEAKHTSTSAQQQPQPLAA